MTERLSPAAVLSMIVLTSGATTALAGDQCVPAGNIGTSVGLAPFSPISVGDIDRDGILDVIMGISEHRLAWFRGLGAPNYICNATIRLVGDSIENVKDIAVGDVDGDGDLDICHAQYGLFGITLNRDTTGFAAFKQEYISRSSDDRVFSVQFGDLDGDGLLDLMYAAYGYNGSIGWHRGLGPELGFSEAIRLTPLGQGRRDAVLGDFNGDSIVDIAYLQSGPDQVHWLKGLGGGQFAPEVVSTADLNYLRLTIGDVDGDADLDILVSTQFPETISWFENTDGLGTFAAPVALWNDFGRPEFFRLEDLDGDKDYDIVVRDEASTELAVLMNTGAAQFSAPTIYKSGQGISEPGEFVLNDIDADGDVDIVVAELGSDHIGWLENQTGIGDFAPFQALTPHVLNLGLVHIADVNGDGLTDLIGTGRGSPGSPGSSPAPQVFLRSGPGMGFGSPVEFLDYLDDCRQLDTADVDGDGLPELAIAVSEGGKLLLFPNTADASVFGPPQRVSSIELTTADGVEVVDLDGDGDLDILGVSQEAKACAWFENRGGGDFSYPIILQEGISSGDVAAADVDGDSDLDYIAMTSMSMIWFEQLSPGQFGQAQIMWEPAEGGVAIRAADVDNDGDIDVMYSAQLGIDKIFCLENVSGDGSAWNRHTVVDGGFSPKFFDSGDIDRDGDIDVMITNASTDKVSWIVNSGSFASPWTEECIKTLEPSPLGQNAQRPALWDIDQDGDLDFYFGSLTLRRYLNFVPAPCPGDASGDDFVNVDDLNAILGAWNTSVGIGDPRDLANNDGFIDVDDLNVVLANWNTVCN